MVEQKKRIEQIELSADLLQQVNGGAGSHAEHSIPCPVCGCKIPVSIPELLSENSLVCPACGLQLSLRVKPSENFGEQFK